MSVKHPVAGLLGAVLLCCASGIAFATPSIQHWQSRSGAKVLFVEDHDIPMLDVAVSVPAGSRYDSKSGLASMTHEMLDLGAGDMDEDAISSGMADIGAELGGDMDQDMASISLRTLSRDREREKALSIMAKVLQHPAFKDEILSREKTRVIAALKDEETKPESIASRAFYKAIYGKHPYALPVSGDVAGVEKISDQDVKDFYLGHYNAARAVVAIMGDVTPAEAHEIAEQLTDELPVSKDVLPMPAVDMQIKAVEERIPHPATQSHILMGAPGMSRTDPDYFTLYVGNYILGGGGFVSRLMNEVREKRGLAYSVYSYFFPLGQPGPFQIGLQTKKDQADEALRIVRKTVADFVANGPTEAELKAAKQNIIGGFPLRIDSNRKILGYLSVIGFYDLPLTYLDDFTTRVDKVNVSEIRDAFARHIHPDEMATVIVGAPDEKSGGPEHKQAE